tara:strand:- start:91 stop:525 length:435 start_codon:yes stop_codon:yes gene_type:complete
MAVQIQSRRSSTANDRPFPVRLGSGELAVNNNNVSPGLFFADNTASPSTGLIKVGPVHIGNTAPNTSPAGFTSLSKGETWLDTASTHIFKVYDGAAFRPVKAVVSVSAGQPANPIDGQLHWDTAGGGNGVLKIYLASVGNWVNA